MRLVTVSIALVFIAVLPFGGTASAGSAELAISEILAGPARDWDGSGAFSSRDDEWVEVRNVTGATIDLSGFLITDGDSLPRYALSGSLAGGAHLIVFGRQSYDWERANGFPAFGLSLANGGDAVLLWKIAAGETLLVDSYTYRSHEAAADRSVARLDDDGAWQVFDGLNPYTGTVPPFGNQCEPTPASANVCGVTPVVPARWGRIKALYR
jgi:hypothetical protein